MLWFLAAPSRVPIATGMHELGVRVHPELATKQLVREGPAEMGNHAPQRLAAMDPAAARRVLRQINPALADRIEAAENDPALKQQIGAEFAPKIAADIAHLNKHVPDLKPEDLEE